ncbi:MAG: PDZ domain-containing protein [Bacilli bacterium]|nr:PDZ domain-containing protein [Bacilli bacterium]
MFSKLYDKAKDYIVNNYKFLISLVVIIVLFTTELPYVVYIPGGIVELNDRIEVEGGYEAEGTLNMSYVSLLKGKIPLLAFSFLMKDWDIEKASEITSEDQSVDELLQLEKLYMASSIDYATILAYQKAGKELNITDTVNNIVYITKEANTDLKIYDKVLSIEGQEVQSIQELKDVVNEKQEGDYVKITVERDGKKIETNSRVYNTVDGLKVGIVFLTTYEYETNPKIEVKTKAKESGSSGGLMLTLAIYNELVEEDITKGKKIVGTGTIDILGNVGEIDGVKYKILGAVKNEADVFLCPVENYEEAMRVKKDHNLDLEIVSVKTFDEAIEYLARL